jgi:hypothetical protein
LRDWWLLIREADRQIRHEVASTPATDRELWSVVLKDAMNSLLTFWTVIRLTFEASVWSTAAWSVLCPFIGIDWVEYFGGFAVIQLLMNSRIARLVGTLSAQQCGRMMKVEAAGSGTTILIALVSSLVPTAIAIGCLSLTSGWTHMHPNWLRTWLFVACALYIYFRATVRDVFEESLLSVAQPSGPETLLRNAPAEEEQVVFKEDVEQEADEKKGGKESSVLPPSAQTPSRD